MQIPIAKLLSVLAILGIFGVVAGITAVTAQDADDGHIPDYVKNYVPPPPVPEFTRQELLDKAMASRAAARKRAPVIQGTPLDMPSDAWKKGLVVTTHSFPIVIDGETIEPLQLPVYQIIRNGEIANISKTTGRFTIGENQKDTFQFLIDQLGADKMQLLPHEYYEERWGRHRQDALEEGGK